MLWYMLATVVLYTFEHAGHDAVLSCDVLATILYTLVFAYHNTVYSSMCLP